MARPLVVLLTKQKGLINKINYTKLFPAIKLVYCTNYSVLLVKNMLCSKFNCQKNINYIPFHTKSSLQRMYQDDVPMARPLVVLRTRQEFVIFWQQRVLFFCRWPSDVKSALQSDVKTALVERFPLSYSAFHSCARAVLLTGQESHLSSVSTRTRTRPGQLVPATLSISQLHRVNTTASSFSHTKCFQSCLAKVNSHTNSSTYSLYQ